MVEVFFNRVSVLLLVLAVVEISVSTVALSPEPPQYSCASSPCRNGGTCLGDDGTGTTQIKCECPDNIYGYTCTSTYALAGENCTLKNTGGPVALCRPELECRCDGCSAETVKLNYGKCTQVSKLREMCGGFAGRPCVAGLTCAIQSGDMGYCVQLVTVIGGRCDGTRPESASLLCASPMTCQIMGDGTGVCVSTSEPVKCALDYTSLCASSSTQTCVGGYCQDAKPCSALTESTTTECPGGTECRLAPRNKNGYCITISETARLGQSCTLPNANRSKILCGGGAICACPASLCSNSTGLGVCQKDPCNCKNGGTCYPSAGGDTGSCKCPPGYSGVYCGTPVVTPNCSDQCSGKLPKPMCATNGVTYDNECLMQCAGATFYTSGACPDICALKKPCMNGGTCTTVSLSSSLPYHCTCPVGYKGQSCEQVDQCDKCRTLPAEPVCGRDTITYSNPCLLDCAGVPIAYKGACQANDPCMTKPCHNGATCSSTLIGPVPTTNSTQPDGTNSPPPKVEFSFRCLCTIGYTGQYCDTKDGCGCYDYREPMCATSGQTFSNGCYLKCAGATLAYAGECTKPQDVCLIKRPCMNGGTCYSDSTGTAYKCLCPTGTYGVQCEQRQPNVTCVCTEQYKPVCGTDGVTYSNQCFLDCAAKSSVSSSVRIAYAYDGVCRGCVCKSLYEPVCATSGVTYSNLCELKCADATYAYAGECKPRCSVQCPYEDRPVCGTDQRTYPNVCELKCAGVAGMAHEGACSSCVCPTIYQPVCGLNGKTYGNICEMNCAGVALNHDGPCGSIGCASSPCKNGAKCIPAVATPTSSSSSSSSSSPSVPPIDSGSAAAYYSSFTCACPTGYVGQFCQQMDRCLAAPSCPVGSYCYDDGSSSSGSICRRIPSVCDKRPCLNGGACIAIDPMPMVTDADTAPYKSTTGEDDAGGAAASEAPAGLLVQSSTKVGAETSSVPVSVATPEDRTRLYRSYICTCPTGYVGDNCERVSRCATVRCAPGYECIDDDLSAQLCRPVSACATDPCRNGGTCVPLITAPAGQVIDYNTKQQSASSMAYSVPYFCRCPPDFTAGVNCEADLPVDGCARMPCPPDSICVPIDRYGKHECRRVNSTVGCCTVAHELAAGTIRASISMAADQCALLPAVMSSVVGGSVRYDPRPCSVIDDVPVDNNDACLSRPCRNGGSCSSMRLSELNSRSFTCTCRAGYYGYECEYSSSVVPPVDPIIDPPASTCALVDCAPTYICLDTQLGARCVPRGSERVCVGNSACQNGGSCVADAVLAKDPAVAQKFRCECKSGYGGVLCEQPLTACVLNNGGCGLYARCTQPALQLITSASASSSSSSSSSAVAVAISVAPVCVCPTGSTFESGRCLDTRSRQELGLSPYDSSRYADAELDAVAAGTNNEEEESANGGGSVALSVLVVLGVLVALLTVTVALLLVRYRRASQLQQSQAAHIAKNTGAAHQQPGAAARASAAAATPQAAAAAAAAADL